MAFAKSKVKRFNDVNNITPAPGTYNPPIGLTTPTRIEKHSNFRNSPTESLASEKSSVRSIRSVQSIRSITSASCFRTPILPARRKLLCTQSERKILPKSNHDEELREKIVECINKTQSIVELEAQIEEFKTQISELKLLSTQKSANTPHELEQLRDQYQCQIDEITNRNESELRNLRNKQKQHEETITQLQNDIYTLNHEKEMLIFEYEEKKMSLDSLLLQSEENLYDLQKDYEELITFNTELQEKSKNNKVLQTKVAALRKRIMDINKKYKAKQKLVGALQKRLLQVRGKLNEQTLEAQREIHMLEKTLMEQELLKKNEMQQLEVSLMEIINDLENKNEVMASEFKLEIAKLHESNEYQVRKLKEASVEQLGCLKRTLDEKKHICMKLSDTERDLKYALDSKHKITMDLNHKKSIINELQRKLSQTIVELNDTREHYGKEIKNTHTENEHLKSQIRRLTITLDETRATLDVLTKRVLESDQGFEQLKTELTTMETNFIKLENEKLELTRKLGLMKHSSQQMNEAFSKEGEMLRKNVDEKLKYCTEMVELYKQQALSVMQQSEAQSVSEVNALNQAKQLQEDNVKLRAEKNTLNEQIKAFDTKLSEALNMINVSKNEIDRTETENVDLKFKINRLESQLASLQVKNESGKIDKLVNENRKLKDEMKKMQNELKVQKELESKINIQNKLIEKLRQEVTSPKSTQQRKKIEKSDKENRLSKNATPDITTKVTNRIESPNTTPLRERNIRQ